MAQRVEGLSQSPTLAITARATAMRNAGHDVVSFAAGEPDCATPEPIIDAAIAAMRAGFTKYTAGSGIRDLREAIAEKFRRENGIECGGDEVVVTCGAKHALLNAILGIVNPGDEVVIVAPYWMSYSEQVRVAGGEPVLAHCHPENDFVPVPADIEAKITPRTKAVMICSPNNPTGAVWPKQVLAEIGEIVLRHELWLISDEVYESLIYEGEHVSPASLGSSLAQQTVTIGSCSKTYAMTGWRIGFMTGPAPLMAKIACVQDAITHPTSFAQKAAITALQMDDAFMNAMRDEYRERRNLMHALVSEIPGLAPPFPRGAFYVVGDFRPYLGERFANDWELAEFLLESAHVAVIPGSVFAMPNYLRFSYAASRDDIRRGVARVAEALQHVAV